MRLISEGPTLHEHAWVAHELDLERKSWPQPGDKRRCVDCGAVQHFLRDTYGTYWVPEGYRLLTTMERV